MLSERKRIKTTMTSGRQTRPNCAGASQSPFATPIDPDAGILTPGDQMFAADLLVLLAAFSVGAQVQQQSPELKQSGNRKYQLLLP